MSESSILQKKLFAAMQICAKAPCGTYQQPRDTILVDQVRGSDAAINNNYKVRLDKAVLYDADGKIAHTRGIIIECMFKLVATGTSDAVTRRSLMGVFSALTLKNAAGHVYFNNLDGRMLMDEMFVRFGRHTQAPYSYQNIGELGSPFPGDSTEDADIGGSLADPLISTADADATYGQPEADLINELKADVNTASDLINQLRDALTGPHSREAILPANAAAGNYYVHVRFAFDLVAPVGLGSQLEGLVPLPFLTMVGRDALQVRIASVIPDVSGVTIGEVLTPDRRGQPEMVSAVNDAPPNATTGYDVHLDMEYLKGVVIDRNWEIDSFALNEVQGVHDKPGLVTQHLSIRYLDEEDLFGADNHDMFSVMIGSFPVMNALSKEQALNRTLSFYAQQMWSGLSLNNVALDLPLCADSSGTRKALIVGVIPARSYEYAAAGPINYKFSRTTHTFTRWLRRQANCHEPDNAKMIAEAIANKCGCGANGTLFGTQANGALCTQLNPKQPLVYVPSQFATQVAGTRITSKVST